MTLDHILVSPEFSARPKKHLASSDSLKAWWPIAKRILPVSPSIPFQLRNADFGPTSTLINFFGHIFFPKLLVRDNSPSVRAISRTFAIIHDNSRYFLPPSPYGFHA